MTKRHARLWILIVLIISSLAMTKIGLVHAGPPINVPEDFPTIQAAVDAASSGDKISIGPGRYNESVIITTDRLKLVAREGSHTVIIDGATLDANGIHVMADGVRLKDLVVTNFAEFVGPGVVDFRVGILVEGGEGCRIRGNLVHSNGDGIVLRGTSYCKVEGNVTRNNIHNGIFLRNDSNHNKVKGNVAIDNGPDMNPAPDFVPAGVGCGIQLSFDSNGNLLLQNNLAGNGRGLQLDRGSTGNSALNNVSTVNSRFGVAALAVGGQPSASGNTIKHNVALANGEFDLIDQNFPPAVGNIWRNNRFATSNF